MGYSSTAFRKCPKISRIIWSFLENLWAFFLVQLVENLPAVQETRVQSLGWEDPPGEGNGHLLQYPCLENPMNREAWRAAVHRAAKSDE